MQGLRRVYTLCSRFHKYLNINVAPGRRYCLPTVIETSRKNVLEVVSEDLSGVTPYFPQSFNLAAYVNSSETLKKLVDLNVNLCKIEKKPYQAERLLKLDFEKNIKNHLMFLNKYVDLEDIGQILTRNPMILFQNLDDLEVRINYLQSKLFRMEDIKRIIVKNPYWLMFSTSRIDRRLGYFQKTFDLTGPEVRALATRQPKVITHKIHSVKANAFVLKEEMGFTDEEIKQLILDKPLLLIKNQLNLQRRFDYIHNTMKISHRTILQNAQILMFPTIKLKQRHLFLKALGRDQYNPKKENYVPLMALVTGTDDEFCRTYGKCSVSDFNDFLKTL